MSFTTAVAFVVGFGIGSLFRCWISQRQAYGEIFRDGQLACIERLRDLLRMVEKENLSDKE